MDASSKSLDEKEYLVNAVTCYVREIIYDSYNPESSWINYLVSYATTVDNSNLFVLLGFSLDIRQNNMPSNKDLCDMYRALKSFMMPYIYEDPNDLKKGYLPATNQLFSDKKIENFDKETFLKKLIHRIAKLETVLIDEVKTETQYKAGNSAAKIGMFSAPENSSGRKVEESLREERGRTSFTLASSDEANNYFSPLGNGEGISAL